MKLKKDRGRFTVRFDMENPDHVRAVEYLERQRARGKAQYITQAILCYEKNVNNRISTIDRTQHEQLAQEFSNKITFHTSPEPYKTPYSVVPSSLDLIAETLADFNR